MQVTEFSLGTGKSTAARSMGKVFYEMGFLSTEEVVECSATDLIGQYVGHTGPKTKSQLEKGLGKVLFIDHAYRLAEGQFAAEAVDELVQLLSTPRYMGRMVVILAGTSEIDSLMAARPSIAGYFQDEIVFECLKADECMTILRRELEEKKISAPFLAEPLSSQGKDIQGLFKELTKCSSWSNARDIKTLTRQMAVSVLSQQSATPPTNAQSNGSTFQKVLQVEQATACMRKMRNLQTTRSSAKRKGNGESSADDKRPRHETTTSSWKSADTTSSWKSAATPGTTSSWKSAATPATTSSWKSAATPGTTSSWKSAATPATTSSWKSAITPGAASSWKSAITPATTSSWKSAATPATTNTLENSQGDPKVCAPTHVGMVDPGEEEKRNPREEEDRNQEEEGTVTKLLGRLAPCPMGYVWKENGDGYRCEGGSHTMSAAEAQRLMEGAQ